MAKILTGRKDIDENAALLVPAGLFMGFGLGFAFNNIPAGMFGGLGFGFLLFAFVVLNKKK